MYYDEHNPPHFHVIYNEYRAAVGIRALQLIDGKLPPRVLGLVVEWAGLHQAELLEMWETQSFHKIEPLV